MHCRRHLNIRGKSANLPAITDKDWLDLQFGIDVGVDYYALSFVRSADVIYELKAYLAKQGTSELHPGTMRISGSIHPEAELSSLGASCPQAACVFKSQKEPQTVSFGPEQYLACIEGIKTPQHNAFQVLQADAIRSRIAVKNLCQCKLGTCKPSPEACPEHACNIGTNSQGHQSVQLWHSFPGLFMS